MRELVIVCEEDKAEVLSDLLIELGALSVSVEDANRDTESETPLFGEPGGEPEVQAWQHNEVVALLPENADGQDFLRAVSAHFKEDMQPFSYEREVADEDWVRLTQSQFEPIQIAGRIWIVPSWHQDNPEVLNAVGIEGNIQIELDPGLAFGTGSHPTTKLCAEWLEQHVKVAQSILDYGCGSGILALVAAKLGARPIIGVDIDQQAVESAVYNAQRNACNIQFLLPDELVPGQFDIVVANILSNPLKVLAPMLCQRVNVGSHLVLSGILQRQAEEVAAAYSQWIDLKIWRAEAGWVCLHGQKH